MKNKIIFSVDSRDAKYDFSKQFGAVTQFPDEVNFDSPIKDAIQPTGDVKCTCYSTCDMATDQDKIIYDITDLFNRIPNGPQGANPRDALKESIANGLLPQSKTERVKHWKSFWSSHSGDQDAFDNLRSTLVLAQSPVGVWTQWFYNWQGTQPLSMGQGVAGNHMYVAEGWKQVNGEPMLIIEAWLGYKLLMPRATFNSAISKLGCGSAVLSTLAIDQKRTKTLVETIMDIIKNLILRVSDFLRTSQPDNSKLEQAKNDLQKVVDEIKPEIPDPNGLLWDTKTNIRHSCRVIMDKYHIKWTDKDLLCAVIQCESGFNIKAKHENKNSKGQILSTDWGICQINDHYHIGQGKYFVSVSEVLNDPEKSVRFLCEQFLKGQLKLWICYSSGLYKKYL